MRQRGLLFGKKRGADRQRRQEAIGPEKTVFCLIFRGRVLEFPAAFFGILFRFLCLFTPHVVDAPVAGKHSRGRMASPNIRKDENSGHFVSRVKVKNKDKILNIFII